LTVKDLGLEEIQIGVLMESQSSEYRFPCIPSAGIDLPHLEKAMEKFYINESFKMAEGNETKAAKMLNLNPHTYRYRHKKLDNRLSEE
jgi:transcriptional regulator with GAF, ATPase, and Fis domain